MSCRKLNRQSITQILFIYNYNKMVRTLGDTAIRINKGDRILSQNGHFEFIGKDNGDFCIHQIVGKKQELWHPNGKR